MTTEAFDHFVEALENVPPELERNFTLMTNLDQQVAQLVASINKCVLEYRNTRSLSKRNSLKKRTDEMFEKLNSFSTDKIDLADLTYKMIDKHIQILTDLGTVKVSSDAPPDLTDTPLLGFDMPLDPHEPKYCTCRSVSHGEMIACDNSECPIEWFHFVCVGLRTEPKGGWYCEECIKQKAHLKLKPKSKSKQKRRRK